MNLTMLFTARRGVWFMERPLRSVPPHLRADVAEVYAGALFQGGRRDCSFCRKGDA